MDAQRLARLTKSQAKTSEELTSTVNRGRSMPIPSQGGSRKLSLATAFEDGSPETIGTLGDVLTHSHSGTPTGGLDGVPAKTALKYNAYMKDPATGDTGPMNMVLVEDSVDGSFYWVSGHAR